MSFFGRLGEAYKVLRNKPLAIVNEVAASTIFVGSGSPRSPVWNLREIIDTSFRQNVVANVCISEIASSIAEPDIVVRTVEKAENVPDGHPLQVMMRQPNPKESKFSFFERGLIHLQAAGAMYIHKDRNRGDQVVGLTLLRPDRMSPVPGPKGEIEWYDYMIEDYAPQRMPARDVIQVIMPDPLDDYNGLPPIMVASRFADLDVEAAEYMRAFFINGGVPAGLLKLKTPARPEERERIQQQWAERYGRGTGPRGSSRWHTVGVINADAEYDEIGTSPEKLRLDGIWGMTETRICAVFGVPPQVVQMRIGMQYSTYENYQAAVRTFWLETLIPMYGRISEKLTNELAKEFDQGLEIVFDTSMIEALRENQDSRVERVVKLFAGGVIPRSRALEMLEQDPLEGEPDIIIIPTGAKEVGKPLAEAVGMAPSPAQTAESQDKALSAQTQAKAEAAKLKLLPGGKEKQALLLPETAEWYR